MTRKEEMMREARKHYDISTFLDGVKWANEHPKSYTIAEYLYKEKGYPISLNGDIPTFEEVVKDIQAYNNYKMRQKACDGLGVTYAEPNLASLWHNANDAPQGDNWKILCVDNFDLFWVMSKDSWLYSKWDEYVEIESVKMWAYIDDLLSKQFKKSEQVKGEHNDNND